MFLNVVLHFPHLNISLLARAAVESCVQLGILGNIRNSPVRNPGEASGFRLSVFKEPPFSFSHEFVIVRVLAVRIGANLVLYRKFALDIIFALY